MLYMLDTDTSSYIIKKHPFEALQKLQKNVEEGNEIVISSITYAELLFGAERSGNPQKLLNLIEQFCSRLNDIQAWDKHSAKSFSVLQRELFKQGTPIGANDTMIAAHALSVKATLISNNTRHFSKVEGLVLENWIG